jgi:hypothetical protein
VRNINIVSKVLSKTPQSKGFDKDVVDREESAEDYGYSSDSDLEDDEDEKVAWSKQGGKSKVHLFDSCGIPGGERRSPCEEYKEQVEQGKIVKIPDMAFVT